MCRHAAYTGPPLGLNAFLDRPEHGLVEQSYRPREMLDAEVNADGFGVGWYRADGAPGVYTNPMPIWSDTNLAHIGRAFESRLWLGSVRSATPGQPVNQANTHPFLVGGLLFSHNGFIHHFADGPRAALRRHLEPAHEAAILGSTDSEHIFAALRQELSASGGAADIPAALRALFARLDQLLDGTHALLNLLFSDGNRVFATRHAIRHDSPSLYVGTDEALFPGASLVVSEPFSASGDWRAVPDHHLVVIEAGHDATVTPL
jgi:glutamine amidotransferase